MRDPADGLFTTPAMDEVFNSEAHVRQMLRFEAALARAEAKAGIIPQEAADAIAAVCRVELFDVATLYQEAAVAGTPVVPLVRMLTSRVSAEGRDFVHWGATSQDVIDTALVLQMREGLDLLLESLMGVCDGCARLAEQHRHTPMAARTLLQQALPITFGLKAARWLAMATRQVRALRAQREQLMVQFGGAAGTLAALGEKGMSVAEHLAGELRLPLPDVPWHAERDRPAMTAAVLGVTAGSVAKIAHDIVLLAQTEVAEVSEASAPGKGASSAMPQKQNPVDTMMALASAKLAQGMVQVILSAMTNEQERAVGGWQAEWAAIPCLFRSTAGAVDRVRSAVSGLRVNSERMRQNLNLGGGMIMAESLTMALAPHIGRQEAQRLVREACGTAAATGSTLRQAALENSQISDVLSTEALDRALEPDNYMGSAGVLIDRALEVYREVQTAQEGA